MSGDFTKQASSYRLARPGYPLSLVDQLIELVGIQPDSPVVDIGAGTGIFTQILVDRGLRVTAVEPNEAMRQQAPELPGTTWVRGTFEETNLADRSQKWAVAAQAFHWADPPRALPEIRRILCEGGHLTVLWNNRAVKESELLQWTEQTIRKHAPEFEESYRNRDWRAVLVSTGDFTFVSSDTMKHQVAMSRDRFLTLWKSHHRLNEIAGPERFASLFKELVAHLVEQRIDTVDVPYICESWTVRRIDR